MGSHKKIVNLLAEILTVNIIDSAGVDRECRRNFKKDRQGAY